jgi:hypothetical protein
MIIRKMRKTLLIFIFTSLFISCDNENEKFDFIGNWNTTSDTNLHINIEYYLDSIVVDNSLFFNTYSLKWKVEDNKLHQEILRNNGYFDKENSVLDFKFNKEKDTLFLKKNNDSVFVIKLRKIKNNFEYLENRLGLELNLPKTNKKLISSGNKKFAFNIYIGKKNDSLIVRTDNYLQNIEKLKSQVIPFYYSKKEQNIDSLKFNIYTDMSVNNKELDSIKTILKKLPIKKIFRIYDSEKYVKNNWKAEINWLGKYEN